MQVFLTGVAGFIGSHLADFLVSREIKVIGIDNLSNGKLENLEQLSDNQNFEFVKGDICDFDFVIEHMKGADAVCHQAAVGSVPRSLKDPLLYFANNAQGTANVMESARRLGIQRVVYASSSSVYGDSERLPKVEEETGQPLSPYAASKVANEHTAAIYSRCYHMETIGLRYFNIFGPRQRSDSQYAAVIPKWAERLSCGKKADIYGTGENSRDFTFVANACEANYLALTKDLPKKSLVFNVGCHKRTNLNQLYRLIADGLGLGNVKPNYLSPRAGDIPHSLADISAIKSQLGYQGKVSIEEGIATYLEWWTKSSEAETLKTVHFKEI